MVGDLNLKVGAWIIDYLLN